MAKHAKTVLFYAFAWFLVSWACIRGGQGDAVDHLLVASGFFLVHGACATLIANFRVHIRSVLLVPYALASSALLLALLLHGLFIMSGGVTGADAIRAVAQTDPQEAIAYLKRLISPVNVIAGASIATLLVATFPHRAYAATARANAAAALLLAVGLAAGHLGSISILAPVRMYVAQYRAELQAFHSMLDARKSRPITGATSDFSGTAIVVIGESTSRRHMSRYGYHRETTPKLDARGDELITFGDVISPHSHTVPALAAALTSSGATDKQRYFHESSIDILSLAKSAGFKTWWLSNQNEFGIWDNPITVIARQADNTRFFSSGVGTRFERSSYDGIMLPFLDRTLQHFGTGRNLVFVHLFATHWPYCSNYPPEFHHFDAALGPQFFGNAKEPDVNCYDNSVRYVDAVLDSMFQALQSRAEPAVLLYFSDHGEAPLLATAHDSFRHSSYHIEVPLLLWANEAFRRRHADRLSTARSNAARPYTTARLFHTLAQLLDIRHSSVDPHHSLLEGALVDIPRSSINGTIRYDEWAEANDYRENAPVNLRRLAERQKQVWAHRINSLGALAEATPAFSGIEMDVVFVDGEACFHVYHPPAPDTSLSLAQMLANSKSKPDLRLWLDWKNATAENMRAAIKCLDALDAQFDIRRRSLVETGANAVFVETNLLSRAGYKHGYYLPTEKVLECIRTCNDAEARALALKIQKAVESGGYSAITFDWRLNEFVKRRLLGWVSRRKLALFSWDMSINIADSDAAPRIEERFSKLDLAGLLVTFPSRFRI